MVLQVYSLAEHTFDLNLASSSAVETRGRESRDRFLYVMAFSDRKRATEMYLSLVK